MLGHCMLVDTPTWLDVSTYGLAQTEKARRLSERLGQLTQWHAERCPAYRAWFEFRRGAGHGAGVDNGLVSYDPSDPYAVAPPLSVSVFKQRRMVSVPDDQIAVQLNSSGTTGQSPSRIFLDATTARWQSLALNRIVESFVGPGRLPLLILDHPGVLRQGAAYSARVAAVLGFQRFGRPVLFAFQDEEWGLYHSALQQFQDLVGQGPGLMVGMTGIVWTRFLAGLVAERVTLTLPGVRLLHGGGWKKLAQQAVDWETFGRGVRTALGVERVHNYYGMVEQVGSIFVECEFGHLHAPTFADVIVRNPQGLRPQPIGQPGILQVVSALPESYPGHSLLTGDWGTVHGYDDCPCGRLGARFSVAGRIQQLEPRGCSDVTA